MGEGESAPVGDTVALMAAEESDIELVAAMEGDGGGGNTAPAAEEIETPVAGESSLSSQNGIEGVKEAMEIFMSALSSTLSEEKLVSCL